MDHDLLERIRRLPRRAEYMLPEQPLHNDDPELDSGAESDQETNRDRPFPRGIDPVSSQLPFPHRNARLTSGAVHARSNRQMEEQDRDDLELENQRTWEELDRVRRWKNRLRQENKSLREETESLRREVKELRKRDEDSRAEIKRLKGRYEDVWHDKVVLAEQLSGPATLPLEILLNIAGFVAGGNLYATLLHFSLASKRIREELKPVFYETMVFDGSRALAFEPGTRQHLDAYKYTKFVYAGAYISSTLVERYFPNVRAILSLLPVRNRDWDQTPDETEGYTSFRTQLSLVHPVRANTLGSLMAHSVKWVMGRSTRYHPIRGVSSVMFEKDGAILASGSEVVERPFRNLVRTCIIGASSAVEAESLGQSIRQLAMFVPVMPKYAEGSRRDNDIHYPTLKIHANTVAALDAWLAGLSTFLLRQPGLCVEIFASGHLTRLDFQQRLLTVAATYTAVWPQIKHEMKGLSVACGAIFFMDIRDDSDIRDPDDDTDDDDDDVSIYFTGMLRYAPATDSFQSEIVERDEETGHENVVFERTHVVEATTS